MPFVDITGIAENWISVLGSSRINISKNLRQQFFLGDKRKVRIFIDVENGLLGVKPSKEGNVFSDYAIRARAIRKYGVKNGRYAAEWNEKHQMLIAKIEFSETPT